MNSGVLAGVLRTAYQIAHPNTEVPKKVDADGESMQECEFPISDQPIVFRVSRHAFPRLVGH